MLLDSTALRAKLEQGDAEKGIAPIVIPETSELTKIRPWDCIYAKWEYGECFVCCHNYHTPPHIYTHFSPHNNPTLPLPPEYPELYYKPDWAAHPFISHIRVMVSYMILEGRGSTVPSL